MKECTLKEAVELCEKNGGSFKIHGWPDSIIGPKTLCTYQPPKKSAFQLAFERIHDTSNPHPCDKKLWNAAIDEVLKMVGSKTIEALKEP